MRHGIFFVSILASVTSMACVRSRTDEKKRQDAPGATAPAATAATNSTAFTVQQCESLIVDAERKLADARNKASADCKKDDDCQLVETSACVPACNDRAIAKKAAGAYQKQREMLRNTSCKLWNDAECARTTPKPMPDCKPLEVACNANKCEAVPAR